MTTATDNASNTTVVLVHGAFADASGYGAVIRELQANGVTVRAPANPLRGLAVDAEYIRSFVAGIDGPVLLVGHSYGGAVAGQASADLDNVVGLVFLAAYGIDVGESCLSVQAPYPAPLLASNSHPTDYDAGPTGPDLYIDLPTFRETFCADVPVDTAAVMAATQRPVAAATLNEQATAAGWRTKPCWYQVSAQDAAIPPDAERFIAERMGATTITIDGSHVAFLTHPVEVAELIASALK